MEKTAIGTTGIKIPGIIFGTSALGNLYTALSDETKYSIVRECFINVPGPVVFDTAGKYGAGLALEKLGSILESLGIDPDDVIISNKLGWFRIPLSSPEPEFEKNVWAGIANDATQKISYQGILECWEQGNNLLGDRYRPQLASVHDPDEFLAGARSDNDFRHLLRQITEAYRALSLLKKNGIVKAVGVGAKNWKTIRLIAGEVDLDWVMIANSMTIYRHPVDLLNFMEELKARGITIINSAVFHAGFLTGGNFFDYVQIRPDSDDNRSIFRWREDFLSVCRKFEIPPANACVQFALSAPGVAAVSLNTSDPRRIRQNVESVENQIPGTFWKEMVLKGLIDPGYQYLKY